MCLLVLVGCCLFGLIGVQQGVVKPPWFDYALGPVRLIGYSNWNANCPPYTGCDPTRQEAYVVWIAVEQSDSNHSRNIYRLVTVPIAHAFKNQ